MTKMATSFVSDLAMSKLVADIDTDDFLGKSGKNTAAKTSPSAKETPDGKDMDEIRMPIYSSQHEDEGKSESPPPRKRLSKASRKKANRTVNESEEKKARESADDPNDGDDEEDGEDEKDPNFDDVVPKDEDVSDEADVLTQQDLEETALNQLPVDDEAEVDGDEEALPMLQSDSDDDDEIEKLEDLGGTEMFGKKDYVFIDNLPKEKHEIAALLKEVNKNIARLEEQFFIEEDSDAEAERFGLKDMPTPEEHNQRLDVLKSHSNIQQFWSIPLCRQIGHPDASGLFDELAAAQLKHANGRLFDVITCDPPW